IVSGLVTSPWDQLRIFSGEAREMRIASKSVIGLVSSNGLERYKTTLLGTCVPCYVPGMMVLSFSSPGSVRKNSFLNFVGSTKIGAPYLALFARCGKLTSVYFP